MVSDEKHRRTENNLPRLEDAEKRKEKKEKAVYKIQKRMDLPRIRNGSVQCPKKEKYIQFSICC